MIHIGPLRHTTAAMQTALRTLGTCPVETQYQRKPIERQESTSLTILPIHLCGMTSNFQFSRTWKRNPMLLPPPPQAHFFSTHLRDVITQAWLTVYSEAIELISNTLPSPEIQS